jgi:hypothetical protein
MDIHIIMERKWELLPLATMRRKIMDMGMTG